MDKQDIVSRRGSLLIRGNLLVREFKIRGSTVFTFHMRLLMSLFAIISNLNEVRVVGKY